MERDKRFLSTPRGQILQGVGGREEMLLKVGCSKTKDVSGETGMKGLGRFRMYTKRWSPGWC